MIYVSFVPQENLSSEVSPQCQLTDDEDEVISDLELSSGSKETFVLEVSNGVCGDHNCSIFFWGRGGSTSQIGEST